MPRRSFCIHTTVLWPFSGNTGWASAKRELLDFVVQGRSTEVDTSTVQVGATQSGVTSAHLHHPPHIFYRLDPLPATQPKQSTEGNKHWRQVFLYNGHKMVVVVVVGVTACCVCMADSWCASWFLTRATSQRSRTTLCQRMRLRRQRPWQPMPEPLQLKQHRRLHPQRRPPVILSTLLVCISHVDKHMDTYSDLMTIFRLNHSRPVAPWCCFSVSFSLINDGLAIKCLERTADLSFCMISLFLCLPWLTPNPLSNVSAAATYTEHSWCTFSLALF